MKRRGVLALLLAMIRTMHGEVVEATVMPLSLSIDADKITFEGDGRKVTMTTKEIMDILEGKYETKGILR